MFLLKAISSALFILPALASQMAKNSSFTNPILPGWHSDPSCIFVAEEHNAFFCATSSFLTFPGMPIYASKDLVNWRLASHVVSRPSQVPQIGDTVSQNGGLWAVTIRYHKGKFYAIVSYTPLSPWSVTGFLFTTTNPYDTNSWSDPLVFPLLDIDPSIFWDDDGKTYLHFSGIHQQTIDLTTGALGPASIIWKGFTEYIPEGPHMYKKDGYYYLMIGEGGTELGHHEVIARSKNISGPYESNPANPILSNQNTTSYFQTVGHADLFQDASGHWWGAALATRSGPQWKNYPMGRETVLFPVTWDAGAWPVLAPISGRMSGWALPKRTREIRGSGPFVGDADVIDFHPGSRMPAHFVHWRFPPRDAFAVSPRGHPNTLRICPSVANLTSSAPVMGTEEVSLVMRVQTDTRFVFSVDVVEFSPGEEEEETGVTAFLTQTQHLDLGVVMLPTGEFDRSGKEKLGLHLRFRVTNVPSATGNFNGSIPTVVKALPRGWEGAPIRLIIEAVNETHYSFSAASGRRPGEVEVMGVAPGTILSGGDGPFTGESVLYPFL